MMRIDVYSTVLSLNPNKLIESGRVLPKNFSSTVEVGT